jgi:hypothetical protein
MFDDYEKLEIKRNQHSLDVKMLIFFRYILLFEKGIFR